MFKNKEKYHVYITNNTLRGMILEVGRHPNNESIIQMPGIRIGNNFYFDMLADRFPGVGETKSLLENLDNSYGIKDKISPTNSGPSYNNLGGGGGPQCLMVPVQY